MIIPLSYPLTKQSPLYPNTPAPVIHPLRSMANGDSANASAITVSAHSGTHIDAPFHFCNKGKTITECLNADTTFFPAYCLEIGRNKGEEIGVSDLDLLLPDVSDAQALLIRTGGHCLRSEDPVRYSNEHPWVSPELPEFLRKNCPRLRLFGIDQISISSVLHRDDGHECHRKFLCGEKPILILEDLNLSKIGIRHAFRIHVYPFLLGNNDGTPVIVLAESE